MTPLQRVERLAAIATELAQLMTTEERQIYGDPVEDIADLVHDLEMELER